MSLRRPEVYSKITSNKTNIFKYKENLNSCSKDEQSLKEIISSLKNCYNI